MFKSVLLLAILLCCSCSTCSKPESIPDSGLADVDIVTEQKIIQEDWGIILPPFWEEHKIDSDIPTNLQYVATYNDNLLSVSKELYSGTFDQFIIESIRCLRDEDVTLIKTSKVELNGIPYVFLESSKDNIHMLIWMTVNNGFAWNFSCGGLEEVQSLNERCKQIAKSFRIQ